jgi:alpha-L-fucosidase
MKKLHTMLVILIFCSLNSFLSAQHDEQGYIPDPDPLVKQKLENWQDLKFGLLMHWGAYSQWGIVESWSICSEDEGWCRRKGEPDYATYKKDYENLKTTFNPLNFDPQRWAGAAKKAGMKYMVFTTKHHDGFCMFDTKYTAYKITDENCPFHTHPRANVTKEIFNSFRSQGLWVGAYFSKPDWHSEDYWWSNFATPDRGANYDISRYTERWQRFVEFTHNQVMELVTDYGDVDILWFDGGWVRPLSDKDIQAAINLPGFNFKRIQSQDINMPELARKVREKQPGLIIVDRAVPGPYQNYLTPENRVPEGALPFPWESCIIAGGGWSYTPDAKYKSPRELIHMLVDIVSKGGNLLLNIGPGPDGTWHDDAYDRLEKIGEWMKINGEAIYETRAIEPYKEGKTCLTRKKDGTVYAIYLCGEEEDNPPSKIWMSGLQPADSAKLTMLGAAADLEWEKVGEGFVVNIPENIQNDPPCQHAWTIKIK